MSNEQKLILEKLQADEVVSFIKSLHINSMIVFGSVITEEFTCESDIDIAILANGKLSINDILNVELFLEDILNIPIDVVDLNSSNLDLFIKIEILNKGKVLYTNDNNKELDNFIDKLEWTYRENENYFYYRRRDLLR
ncbi:type VII toxin-antitoxin system MntA family adenylyltransferase antitoxin [Clostridium hydrogeniformans]|uniref:type VII toxin-antitoxin system MntA family adenylyltransferase antitoxin n=1 Tax=Clostridium hydrogeniformans TaxID=349933 RepID=UPI00054EB992|nr:nucleotidyltransferase domain-containing protein [Clostridium hydrogeniformans]